MGMDTGGGRRVDTSQQLQLMDSGGDALRCLTAGPEACLLRLGLGDWAVLVSLRCTDMTWGKSTLLYTTHLT